MRRIVAILVTVIFVAMIGFAALPGDGGESSGGEDFTKETASFIPVVEPEPPSDEMMVEMYIHPSSDAQLGAANYYIAAVGGDQSGTPKSSREIRQEGVAIPLLLPAGGFIALVLLAQKKADEHFSHL